MKREDWQQAYEPIPEALARRVSSTLANLEGENKMIRKRTTYAVVIALALILALTGVAIALSGSGVVDILGWFYGDAMRERLLAGESAPAGKSFTLGDVTYTLDDVVYSEGELYGSGRITVAEGKQIVLIAEDYQVSDPAGYLLHYGTDEVIPEDAPSYAELATQQNCDIVLAKCVPNGLLLADGTLIASDCIGYLQLPQPDGSILFTFELMEDQSNGIAIPITDYAISLYVGNWRVTPEGEWLREEPNNTWLREDWIVEIAAGE